MKPKKIIIEGLNRVGKTTYIKAWMKGDPSLRMCHETAWTDYTVIDVLDRFEKYDIFDRSFIGELVWSKVFKRTCRLSKVQMSWLFIELAKKYDITYVWIHRNQTQIKKDPLFKEKITYDMDVAERNYQLAYYYLEAMNGIAIRKRVGCDPWKLEVLNHAF